MRAVIARQDVGHYCISIADRDSGEAWWLSDERNFYRTTVPRKVYATYNDQ
jgi:hypothetical protein